MARHRGPRSSHGNSKENMLVWPLAMNTDAQQSASWRLVRQWVWC